MQEEELLALAARVKKYQCEFQNVEVKAAEKGCPTRLFDTLSSFSNQDDGGVILFGLDEAQKFKTVGVYDVQDLQHKVAEQCKQMEPPVRPLFTVAELDEKCIVSAEIPGADVADRPVFYRGVGRLRGSYIRSGEADELMNEYEIYSYDAFRRRVRDDLRIVGETKRTALLPEALEQYLIQVKAERENLRTNVSDERILELMGVMEDGQPTMAGLMAFGEYPQAQFPQLSIVAVVIPGTRMGDVGEDGERFIANKRIEGTISQMLAGAVDFVKRNMRVKTVVADDGVRRDKPEFPVKAVREAILNALIHRDYSVHSENVPIRIHMYSDRMEIINSGGLYGRISIDSLGKVQPDTRNPALANILEILHVTENRYSGIPTIRRELREAGLPEPEFTAQRGEFKVVFRNNITQRYPDTVKEDPLVYFCRTPRSREEITEFTGFSRYYTMKADLEPLIRQGLIKLTIPDKPKSSKQRYYSTEEE